MKSDPRIELIYVRVALQYLDFSTPYETHAYKDDAFAGHELWSVQKDGDLRKSAFLYRPAYPLELIRLYF